jgi:tetratricopeptide (TPR) repeat protein
MQVAKDNLEIAYHATGYYDKRVAELRDRLARDPQDREARWELGRTYASLGHFEEAIEEFETLLTRQPGDVPALLQYGLALRGMGDLDRATDAFSQARALDPESPVILFYFGESLYNRGLNEPARTALEEAVARNPDHADAYYLLAFVYGDMGDHEKARAATKKATALNPTFARAQSNLSLNRYRGLRTSQPHQMPRPKVSEGGALAHYNLGLAFRQKGYYVEALREYKLALDAGRGFPPRCARRWRRCTCCGATSPRRWSCTRHWSPRTPSHPSCGMSAGSVFSMPEGATRPVPHTTPHSTSIPDYALAWNNLGVLRTQIPEDEEALDSFHRALMIRPDLVVARLNLALALFHRRRLQLSLEAYRQVLDTTPTNAVAWNGVGLVLVELKRFEDARNAFGRAVDADPDSASAHYNLSFALSNLGDFDGALRATKRALELDPFYVAQKYVLSIDLQYENPEISIVRRSRPTCHRTWPTPISHSTPGCWIASSTSCSPPRSPRLRRLWMIHSHWPPISWRRDCSSSQQLTSTARSRRAHPVPAPPRSWGMCSPGGASTAKHWSGSGKP